MKILFFLGIGLVLLVIIDILWTTLWIDGGEGIITSNLSNFMWKLMSKIPARKELSGPITLISVLFGWVTLLWFGWFLVFASSSSSLINTQNDDPLVWQNFVYYAGYTIFNLGSGEYAPASPFWQILTNLASGTGTLFLALGTSYILSIVGAVVKKRSFAREIFTLGSSSEEILIDAWNGDDFSAINSLLGELSKEITSLAVNHKAYPLLHYYHTKERNEATALAIPIIDNLFSILEHGIEEDKKPNPILLKKARNAVGDYLKTLEKVHINIPDEALVSPNLDRLAKENLPVIENEVFQTKIKLLKNRRQKLLGLLIEDMWEEKDLEWL